MLNIDSPRNRTGERLEHFGQDCELPEPEPIQECRCGFVGTDLVEIDGEWKCKDCAGEE